MDDSANENDLVMIRSCRDSGEANLLRSVLMDAGIHSFVQGENHRSMLGAMGTYIELRLTVRAEDASRAKAILEQSDPAPSDASGASEHRVFRVRPKRRNGNPIPAILGILCAVYLLSEGHYILGAIMGALGALFIVGHRLANKGHGGRCSTPSCQTFLPEAAQTCPSCGGKVSGVIGHENERLGAMEKLSGSSPTSPPAE